MPPCRKKVRLWRDNYEPAPHPFWPAMFHCTTIPTVPTKGEIQKLLGCLGSSLYPYVSHQTKPFLLSMILFSGLLKSLYNWVGCHPLYTLNNEVFFHCSTWPFPPRSPRGLPFFVIAEQQLQAPLLGTNQPWGLQLAEKFVAPSIEYLPTFRFYLCGKCR